MMAISFTTVALFFGGVILFVGTIFIILIIKNRKASVKFEINPEDIKKGLTPENFTQQAINLFQNKQIKPLGLKDVLLKLPQEICLV